MGNWRDRPRRIFRKQKTPWSAIRNYDHDPPLEFWQDGIPLWEKKFCREIGHVPWGKVVDSKKFIDCHTNILNWDDSACEEAFHNAKRRFWAEINGHQCDIYLPDPNIYIDKIDWSPEMDSEMIKELDWAYFGRNVPRSDVWSECKNKKTRNFSSVSTEGHIEEPGHVDNPQEHGTKCFEIAEQGWSQWNLSDSEKVNNDGNPWDSYITQKSSGMVDNSWRDKAHQGVTSWKTKGFASDARNKAYPASNFDHYSRPWNNSYDRNARNLTDRIRPNIRGNEQNWKYQGRYGKRPKDVAFEKVGSWGSSWHHSSSQKGEGPHQYVSSWRVFKASKR